MSESKSNLIKPLIEIQTSDPKLWEKDDQDSLLGLFKLLIEIDMRNNPENYKLTPESLKIQNNTSKPNQFNKL